MANEANESTIWLYDQLRGKGYNVGRDVDEFDTLMRTNADSRQWAYDTAKRSGLNVGKDIDEFSSLVGGTSGAVEVPGEEPAVGEEPVLPSDREGAPESGKGWKPTPLQKAMAIASVDPDNSGDGGIGTMMGSGIRRTVDRFARNGQEAVENLRRLAESDSPEGRRRQRAAEMQARMMGTTVDLVGLTPHNAPRDEAAEDSSGDDGKSRRRSLRGPVAQGVVRGDDGKLHTRWMMPDGSLTTDLLEADKAAGAAREARLEREFTGRMRDNGLDPDNPEDVDRQSINDRMDRVKAELKERNEEALSEAYSRKDGESVMNYFFRILGSNPNTQSASVNRGVSLYDDSLRDSETNDLVAEQRLLNDAATAHEASRLERGDGLFDGRNVVNFGKGAADVALDVDTYAGGTRNMHAMGRVMRLKSKLESGEKLTDGELRLAEAMMLRGRAPQDMPHGYTAGRTTAEMARFMFQMMANPTSGFGKALADRAWKRLGEKGWKAWSGRILGTVAGDVASSAFLANTLQAPATLGDASERYLGEVVVDGKGDVSFVGGDGLGKSFMKAEGAATIENYTEMLGSHLGIVGTYMGKGVGAGVRKLGGGRLVDGVTELATRIKGTDWAKGIADFERKTQWNGSVGEILEEEAGIILNSALVGDNKFSDLWDKEQQIDIALGVGVFGAFVSGIKSVGYPAMRYRARHSVETQDGIGRWRFQDDWDGIRDAINGAGDGDLSAVVTSLINEHAQSQEQAKAIAGYASALMRARGFNLAEAAMRDDSSVTREMRDAEDSFDDGYEMQETQEMRDARIEMEREREHLAGSLSEDQVAEFDADPIGALSRTYDQDLREIATDYVNARMVYEGMIQRVRDDVDGRVEQSNAMIEGRVNRETGMIQPATVRDAEAKDGRRVYIVNGSVAMYDDGSGVDTPNSSESIIVRDAETGKVEFVDPARFLSVDEGIDAETEKEAARKQIVDEIAVAAANNIDGVLSFDAGETYSVLDKNGEPQEVSILGPSMDENGMPVEGSVDIQWADGQILPVATSDLQQMVEAADNRRLEQFEQEREAQRRATGAGAEAAEQPATVSNQPETVPNSGETPQNPAENAVSSQVEAAQPMTPAESVPNSSPSEVSKPMTAAPVENEQQPVYDENGFIVPNPADVSIGNSVPAQPKQEQTPLERIPRDAKGEPVYEQAEPDMAWDALVEQTEGDEDIARSVIEQTISEKEGEMKKLSKQKPKAGLSVTQKIQAEKDKKKAMEGIQQSIDHWRLMAGIRARRDAEAAAEEEARQAAEREEAERWETEKRGMDKRLRDTADAVRHVPEAVEVLKEMDPQSMDEVAAWLLSRHKVLWSDTKRGGARMKYGVASHTGFGEGERRKLLGLFASEEKGGISLDRLSEDLFKEACDMFGVPYDNKAARDALIERIGESRTMGDIRNYIANRRIERAVRVAEQYDAFEAEQRDEHYQEAYHMSYDDYEAYEEQMIGELENIFRDFDEQEFYGIIADELANQYEYGLGSNEEAVAAGESSGDGRGVEVLPGAESGEAGGASGNVERQGVSGEAGDALRDTTGGVHEGASGVEASQKRLNKEEAIGIIAKMEMSAVRDPEISLSPESWHNTFGLSNSIDTPLGKVKMGDGQYQKLVDKKRSAEFGMVVQTLQDPDVVLIEPSEAKEGQITERGFSYVFVKTFIRDGKKFKYYTSVSVLKDGMEVSVSSHIASKTAIMKKLQDMERAYTKQSLLPNSSEWHLAEHPTDVPDLLPTQGKSDAKIETDVKLNDIRQKNTSPEGGNSSISHAEQTASAISLESRGDVKGKLVWKHADNVPTASDVADGLYSSQGNMSDPVTEGTDAPQTNTVSSDGKGTDFALIKQASGEESLDGKSADESAEQGQTVASANSPMNGISGAAIEAGTGIETVEATIGERIAEAEAVVNTEPTDAQKEAGNYRKGHVQVGAFDVTIENPKGSVRRGTDADGKRWETTMTHTYGYIRGTKGVDGDHIDVYISSDVDGWNGGKVFVVDQYNPDGSFDEHKVMLGFNDRDEAFSAYLSNYEDGWEKGRRLDVTGVNLDDFEKWIESSKRKTKPFAEYKSVKPLPAAEAVEPGQTGAAANTPMNGTPEAAVESGAAMTGADAPSQPKGYAENEDGMEQPNTPVNGTDSASSGKASGGHEQTATAIEDFGEKLEGARKDLIRDFAKSVGNVTVQSLIELPLSKAFKRPNLRKMVDAGIISDEDASLAEAIMLGLIYSKNKPAMSRMARRKREIAEWAQETYDAIHLLGEVLSGDKERRDKALAERRDALDERLAATNRHIDRLREWNPGKNIPYLTEIPDEVEVIKRILEAIGHKAGEKINLPLTRLELGQNGTTYRVSGPTKQGALWFRAYHESLDGAIGVMTLAARLARGDRDVEIPEEFLAIRGIGNPHREPTGRFEVFYWGRNGKDLKTAVFSDRQKADEFAVAHEGKVTEQMRYTGEYDSYTATVINPLTGNRHPIGKEFTDRAELAAWMDGEYDEVSRLGAEAIANEMGTKAAPRDHFYVAASWHNGKMVYSIVSNDKNNPWPIIQDFPTRKKAEEHLAAVKGQLEEDRRERISKEKAVVYFNTGEERKGSDHRNGKNATPEMYDETFGFRGVQFGNWTNAEDRQMAMNQAYDALMDLAEQLGLSPRALSLYGELGLAFGARGTGGASAHYEPSQVIINLTKTRGAGALAHEWWHALDNYLGRHAGVTLGHATHGNGMEKMDQEVGTAIGKLIDAVVKSNYGQRSGAKGDYWGRHTEMTARLFETWISERIKGAGEASPFLASGLSENALHLYQTLNYLAYKANEHRLAEQEKRAPNVMSKEEFIKTPESLRGYPYPTVEELKDFAPYLERLFGVLAEKEQTDGMMVNEPRRRYGAHKQPTVTGMSLFDWADAEERNHQGSETKDEKAIAAEEANAALDSFAETYGEWLKHNAELEAQLDAEGVDGDLRDELIAQMESEETRIVEEREKLEEKLRDYYAMDNTPDDASRIAHDMVGRMQAEVEIRHRKENILSDILNGSDDTPIGLTSDEAADEVKIAEVKTGGGLISYEALGHLPDAREGEFAYVERKFSRTGEFSFTGVDKIHDRGDVAYLFRSLENYSVENVFAVLVKDGKARILHIGMGTATSSLADMSAIRAGVDAFGADKIYLVHNHPSGTMVASQQDRNLMRTLESAFGDKIAISGIIIDTTSGRYVEFDGKGQEEVYDRPRHSDETVAAEVYHFDQADRSKMPEETMAIRNSNDVTNAIGKLRFGDGKKVSYLILAHNGHVIGNFHTDYTAISAFGLAEEMASVAAKYGGTSVIVYGNMPLEGAKELKEGVAKRSLGAIRLTDALGVRSGIRMSAVDEGILYEDGTPYGTAEVHEPMVSGRGAAEAAEQGQNSREDGQSGIKMDSKGTEEESDSVRYRLEEDDTRYRLREDEPPTKTGIGYKVFVLKNGMLYPPMVANPNGAATPVGVWLDADAAPVAGTSKTGRQQVKAGGKGTQGGSGKLAYRPGWHLGVIPYALQFNRKGESGEKELFPANFVWAEVEYANDVDYQEEAMSYGYNKNGKFQHSYAGLPRLPINGAYKYRTNPNPETDPWIITGAMKVNRLLTPTEVDEMVIAAGREPQKRQNGAVTDEQINELNTQFAQREREGDGAYSDAEVSMEGDPWSKAWGESLRTKRQQREYAVRERRRMVDRVGELAERLNLGNVEIVTDASQLEGRRARAKGFFDRRTGKITIVIPNNISVMDVEQTLLHEAVAHYGLRQLLGKHFDEFLNKVYEAAENGVKERIDLLASRNGWNRRVATEEYLAGLAEDTDFEHAESRVGGWFDKIKRFFIDMLFKAGFRHLTSGSISDNELRYILWRSYQNMANPGRYHVFEWEAEDVAMQYSLGVGEYAPRTETVTEQSVAEAGELYEENEQFNSALEKWERGDMAASDYIKAGLPHGVMKLFMPNVPLILRQKVLSKSRKKHSLTAAEMKNLPYAMSMPIFVFKSSDNSISVLTELRDNHGRNIFVAVNIGIDKQLGHVVLEVNDITTIHGREVENVVLPVVENNSLVWVDKEKGLSWLSSAKSNSQAIATETFDNAAKIVENFENPTISEQNNNAGGDADVYFRDGDFTPRDRSLAAQQYERMLNNGWWQFREATQDSMLGLRSLYEAVLNGVKAPGRPQRIEDVAGYENAYLYENRMSSTNNGEQHRYFIQHMKPLFESIHKLCGSDELDRRILTDYMIAKHGLERNAYMRNEAAANGEETERDFAGLCGLTGEDDWQAAEAVAQQMVDDYEADHDTAELWGKVKNATAATLEKIYLSGMISKDTYNKVLGMYDYYIPLRGWDETTSDEVYGYLTSKDGPLMGNVFKKAEGRKSKADDPIATIAMMADDAIRQGNRNIMKQRFLNFVHGNPSDLVSVNEMWVQHNDITDEWEPVFADLQPDMTHEEIESEIAKFEAKMEALRNAEPDKYMRGREAQNVPYKVVRGNLSEHQVLVRRNGRTYVMTINGNPRAAQALNGLTNPNVETGGVIGNMLKLGEYVNRHLSAFYTTRNPDFVVSNFLRDMLYSNCMTWVKENPRYALRFHKNFGRVNPAMLLTLLHKWENDKLNDSEYLEKMFKEFMLNGGETGYTSVKDIEGHKRTIASELKKRGSVGRKAWNALGMQLDLLNRSVENCARFAAFLTSREMGRTLDRSIYDAKEISVNFNKKGSGGKFVNATGQKSLGKLGSYLGGGGRIAYVFWNAGIQGMTNFGRAGKRNPGKALGGAAALFTLGYVIPMLAQMMGGGDGDDDDKNAYYNLPEYVRRSNICFKAGEQWITIPLPIEYRAIYGMGELACGVISGNERYSNSELAMQMAGQVSQVMPLDMLEGGGGINPFIPSAFKPMTEAYILNKGWTGLPVYKDTPYNKNDPEWTKAYQSADQHLVEFTKWLNETTGGNDYKKGIIDVNPAKLEYLLSGTFGGAVSTIGKLKKMGETALGDREFEWRNMLLANRVVKSGDERTANRKLQNEYFKYLNEYEETNRLRRKYENAADDGILGYAERADFLYNSAEYLRFEIFGKYKPDIDAIRQEIKEETDETAKKELESELYGTMRELVDKLHDTGK